MYDKKLDYKELVSMTCEAILNRYDARLIKVVTENGHINHSIHGGVHANDSLRKIFHGHPPKNFALVKEEDILEIKERDISHPQTLLEIVYNGKLIPPSKATLQQVIALLGDRYYSHQSHINYKKRHSKHY